MKIAHGLAAIALVSLGSIGLAWTPARGAAQGDDSAFATQLWDHLVALRMVGPWSMASVPYPREGQAHGATLVTLQSTATVGDIVGEVIVKRSYGGEGATRENIISRPTENLEAITVMFKRAGYDPDNQDWFWAMYMPDGRIAAMDGMTMAGKTGMCIACHRQAPGGDYKYLK